MPEIDGCVPGVPHCRSNGAVTSGGIAETFASVAPRRWIGPWVRRNSRPERPRPRQLPVAAGNRTWRFWQRARTFSAAHQRSGRDHLGLDVTSLLSITALSEEAWRHWLPRLGNGPMTDAVAFLSRLSWRRPASPARAGLTATLLPTRSVSQPDTLEGDVRHGPCAQHDHPHARVAG